jgi:uncharacterized repeat protein (TIGR01451 family)
MKILNWNTIFVLIFLLTTFTARGQRMFDKEHVIAYNSHSPIALYTPDLDGDGDADILTNESLRIIWYENLGGGSFSTETIIGTQSPLVNLLVEDLDGDGDQDILYATYGSFQSNEIGWYENLGSGNFSSEIIIFNNVNNTNGASKIYATDLDGDNDIDILFTSGTGTKVAWYENLGSGNFSSEIIISNNAGGVSGLKGVDLDSDGDKDILCYTWNNSYNRAKLMWYENLGNNTFSTEYLIDSNLYTIRSIYTTDIDEDGSLDVLILNGDSTRMLWYKNLGSNNFSSRNIMDNSSYYYSGGHDLHGADLDGDSDKDLIVGLNYDLFWLENIGSGNYIQNGIQGGAGASAISSVDVDGDGDKDIVIARYPHNIITWLENRIGVVRGSFYKDLNSDCVRDTFEMGLFGKQAIITPGNIIVTAEESGMWSIDSLPVGNYTITVDTSGVWYPSCSATQTFSVVHSDSALKIPPMGFFVNNPCSEPSISLSAPFLRPGFSGQRVNIQVCNDAEATDYLAASYVIVELDSLLTINSGYPFYTDIGNNQYQISLGTIYPGQCRNALLNCTLDTAAILGTTLCLKARLYPVDSCVLDNMPNQYPVSTTRPCLTNYDGSSLEIEGLCIGDSIHFEIKNNGTDMTCQAPVLTFVDGQYVGLDSVQLIAGDSTTFTVSGQNGKTIRMEVFQHPLHPGNSLPSATVERCGSDISNWTSNLVNILPPNDADPVVDIYCGLVTGSYDPNDKTGFPLGVGSAHDILPNQKIEYLIRFQNTGTDTAFTVVIRDTLSADFNIFSLKSGASSHNYSFKTYGPRVLEWTFDNIMLPDSNVNEPASNGFIQFEVEQMPSLSNGTVLENTAAIYFDFNAPIITNTSIHTINTNISPFNDIQQIILEDKLNIRMYPNPTNGIVYIDKMDNESLDFLVVDNLGRILLSKKSVNLITNLDLSNLPSGVYFITVSNGRKMATQKIIKQ